MDGVRVLDCAGKVLYVICSVGDMVSIGRDKRKCGIALAVDAQGISRVHGSLTWTTQKQVMYCDSSTYGTIVDGKLVKGKSQTVQDGSQISVGDVELVIAFPCPFPSSASTLKDSLRTSKQNLVAKRKGVAADSLLSECKRSKLEVKGNSSLPRQTQISSFFQKRPYMLDEDDCVILAEDTPRSQIMDSVASNIGKAVSFVGDSVALSYERPLALLPEKSDNLTITRTQPSSTGIVLRKKKQCIFDVNQRPDSRSVVLAEDTQPEIARPTRSRSFRGKEPGLTSDVTCIQDSAEQTAQPCQSRRLISVGSYPMFKEDSLMCSASTRRELCGLRESQASKPRNDSLRKSGNFLSIKKANIDPFSCTAQSPREDEDAVASDETTDRLPRESHVSDILKLVSSGKCYDEVEEDADTDEEKGLEIDRVVLKLGELVHYADIERPPSSAVGFNRSLPVSTGKSANFKRFKKASQGRFNTSLSSASFSCVIGGNDDLVDFRQLS